MNRAFLPQSLPRAWLARHSIVVVAAGALLLAAALHALGPLEGPFAWRSALHILIAQFRFGDALPLCLAAALLALLGKADPWPAVLPRLSAAAAWAFLLGLLTWLAGGHEPAVACAALLTLLLVLRVPSDSLAAALAMALGGYLLISYAFTILKAYAFARGAVWDPVLATADEMLRFAGPRDALVAHAHARPGLLALAGRMYEAIFPCTVMFAVAAGLLGRSVLQRYALGLMLVYVLGGIGYWLMPAWGPFAQASFDALAPGWRGSDWQVARIQGFIANHSLAVVQGRMVFDSIAPFAFVSAMPSLHVATPALALMLLWRESRPLRLLSVAMVAAGAYSAVVTGMHYVVDLLAGLLLAWLCAWLARRVQSPER